MLARLKPGEATTEWDGSLACRSGGVARWPRVARQGNFGRRISDSVLRSHLPGLVGQPVFLGGASMGAGGYQHIIAWQHAQPQRAVVYTRRRSCSPKRAGRWATLTVSEGAVAYRLSTPPCSGIGVSWSSAQLDAALGEEVAAALLDDEGKRILEELLAGLPDTDFSQDNLERVVSDPEDIEDWRVGEAIAETYLTEYRSCHFPWPDARDARKHGSSLPGADLVGFSVDKDGDCLAFGEVKSSGELSCPPSTMYGRTGLKKQLEDLRDCETIRDDLLKYLGYRAEQASWKAKFIAAARRYLQDKSDIQLYGVLIRDVPPDDRDLRTRVESLAQGCPRTTSIELLALYLPANSLSGIGAAVLATRKAPDP